MIEGLLIDSIVWGKAIVPSAVVVLEKDGKKIREAACGENLIDALFKAFCRAVGREVSLIDCQISEELSNGNLNGKAKVRISVEGDEKEGIGNAEDGKKAFLMALVKAMNQFS